jgi:hypothetical protein
LRVETSFRNAGTVAPDANRPWWQAPQHTVQFRTPRSGEADGLPSDFAAPVPIGVLPFAPAPLLPEIDELGLPAEWTAPAAVLPDAARYALVGGRPGAMLSIRNQLLRLSDRAGTAAGGPRVFADVAVQHRVPRPLCLPPNEVGSPDSSFRTWASPLEPEASLTVSIGPADELLYVRGSDAAALRLEVLQPAHGTITDEATVIEVDLRSDLRRADVTGRGGFDPRWVYRRAWLRHDARLLDLPSKKASATKLELGGTGIGDFVRLIRPGGIIELIIDVAVEGDEDFHRTLVLPLRVAAANQLPLLFEPRFARFEDPEYNRRLATPAPRVEIAVGQDGSEETLSLAADRVQYNPGAEVIVRADWIGPAAATTTAGPAVELRLTRVAAAGQATRLTSHSLAEPAHGAATHKITTLSLASSENDPALRWEEGDVVLCELIVNGRAGASLELRITDRDPLPATSAAYALLRSERPARAGAQQASNTVVQVVRYATSPIADRIELVDLEDLRTGLVRRRAVFRWIDTVRAAPPGTTPAHLYAVQKLASNGSTHVPEFETKDWVAVNRPARDSPS